MYWYFQQWEAAGATEALLTELRVKARRQADRADEPTAGIIDSQSVKGADIVGQGFAGRLVDWARDTLRTTLEILRKPADQHGFSIISRRWAVERTLAWLTACRRLAHDYERDPAVSEAIIRWAAIAGMARRLSRSGPARRQAKIVCA
ncbi:MAG TPA: transposase [Nonomuraea sp.]|nr:transposase [Nonomuraea sp.]